MNKKCNRLNKPRSGNPQRSGTNGAVRRQQVGRVALAEELLECIDDSDPECLFIQHPLMQYAGYDLSGEHNRMLNGWLEKKTASLKQALAERNWSRVLMLHEKPWRFQALLDYAPDMSDKDYFTELGAIWIQVENLWRIRDQLLLIFNPFGRDLSLRRFMMTEDEQAVLDGLPETVKIYRGCGPENEDGWSWTLEFERAVWFARRPVGYFAGLFGGLVLTAECHRSSIIAFKAQEDEIIINPSDLTVIDRQGSSDRG